METVTIPAPTRGIVMSENEAYMQPGSAVVMDNWRPTMRGASLRGGCVTWCQLPETTPVISMFEYNAPNSDKMFAANINKVYDVTTTTAAEIANGRTSGNYAAAQIANQGGNFLVAVNDAGDPVLRFDGTSWESMGTGYVPPGGKPSAIDVDLVKYPDALVDDGQGLVYVWKYRNRLFFIERDSMNAWYLPLNAVGGQLDMIPLSGGASRGGKLLFGCTWSIDAGDGVDDKCCFFTTEGEVLVFTGSDPSNAANWRQEGRYGISPPLGMNAHAPIGGDVVIMTVDGIIPLSGAITKDRSELELAAITRNIKPMWREEVNDKREHPWTLKKWDEYGGLFVTLPGGLPGKYRCLVANLATGAWCRYTGWDAMCWGKMDESLFFGTQAGKIMQCDRTGYDDGQPYLATLVGGWEMFQSPSQTVTWRQSRVSFAARRGEPFAPQISATTDYVVTLPPPPPAGPDLAVSDVWDEGMWGPGVNYGTLWLPTPQTYTLGQRAYEDLADGHWDCAVAITSATAALSFAEYRAVYPTHWTFADPQPPPMPTPWLPPPHGYTLGQRAYDADGYWDCAVAVTSSVEMPNSTFAEYRTLFPTHWVFANPQPPPPPTPEERVAYAQWDQPNLTRPAVRNTLWVSIGMTGFTHAPVIQVTVAQQAKPQVDLIAIAATFERAGVNV
jgi:hypothetical protein